MSWLLDSDICIALLGKGEAKLRTKFLSRSPDELFVCSVVKAELIFGAQNSFRVAANVMSLERFWAPIQSLVFDDAAAARYGEIRASLRRSGTPIGGNDMMIAAIALANDVSLVTRNLDEFTRVAGLRVERW